MIYIVFRLSNMRLAAQNARLTLVLPDLMRYSNVS